MKFSDCQKRCAREKINSEDIPRVFDTLEKIATENGTGHYVGDSITIADLYLYAAVTFLTTFPSLPEFKNSFCKYENQKKIICSVKSHPKVREYYANRVKLYYFDILGLGEVPRLILTLGDIPFTDVRLTAEQFKEKKEAGHFRFG